MQEQAELSCSVHAAPEDCRDALISYSDKFREYGLFIHDGGSSSQSHQLLSLVWVKAARLSARRWFEELAALGFDDPCSGTFRGIQVWCLAWRRLTLRRPPSADVERTYKRQFSSADKPDTTPHGLAIASPSN